MELLKPPYLVLTVIMYSLDLKETTNNKINSYYIVASVKESIYSYNKEKQKFQHDSHRTIWYE